MREGRLGVKFDLMICKIYACVTIKNDDDRDQCLVTQAFSAFSPLQLYPISIQ